MEDVDEAISTHRRAVALVSEEYPGLPAFLNNLGIALRGRFSHSSEPSDFEEAISAHRKAVSLTPKGHIELPGRLIGLGTMLHIQFERTGNLSDISEAISTKQAAVAILPEGHSDIPGTVVSLGHSLYDQWRVTRNSDDLKASISNFQLAATCRVGSPREKLDAAMHWARRLCLHEPQSPDVMDAFEGAIRLVVLMSGLERTINNRYVQLQDVSGIPLEAAAAALELGHPDRAVEWLEQGRCLVWGQLHTLRTPLEDLEARDSALAHRLRVVAQRLDSAGSSRAESRVGVPFAEKVTLEDAARAQLDLAKEWEELLTTTRALPGFSSFLQPSPCSNLLEYLPPSGFVVIINVDKRRCDAIVLSAGFHEPLHIPLSKFSLKKAKDHLQNMMRRLRLQNLRLREGINIESETVPDRAIGQYRQKNYRDEDVVRNVLSKLWVEVVKPIIDTLGLKVRF
jgi:hypothetical protein